MQIRRVPMKTWWICWFCFFISSTWECVREHAGNIQPLFDNIGKREYIFYVVQSNNQKQPMTGALNVICLWVLIRSVMSYSFYELRISWEIKLTNYNLPKLIGFNNLEAVTSCIFLLRLDQMTTWKESLLKNPWELTSAVPHSFMERFRAFQTKKGISCRMQNTSIEFISENVCCVNRMTPECNLVQSHCIQWSISWACCPHDPRFVCFISHGCLLKPNCQKQNRISQRIPSDLSSGCITAFHCRFILAGVRFGWSLKHRQQEWHEPIWHEHCRFKLPRGSWPSDGLQIGEWEFDIFFKAFPALAVFQYQPGDACEARNVWDSYWIFCVPARQLFATLRKNTVSHQTHSRTFFIYHFIISAAAGEINLIPDSFFIRQESGEIILFLLINTPINAFN